MTRPVENLTPRSSPPTGGSSDPADQFIRTAKRRNFTSDRNTSEADLEAGIRGHQPVVEIPADQPPITGPTVPVESLRPGAAPVERARETFDNLLRRAVSEKRGN
jgi:hypothetical protein